MFCMNKAVGRADDLVNEYTEDKEEESNNVCSG